LGNRLFEIIEEFSSKTRFPPIFSQLQGGKGGFEGNFEGKYPKFIRRVMVWEKEKK